MKQAARRPATPAKTPAKRRRKKRSLSWRTGLYVVVVLAVLYTGALIALSVHSALTPRP